MKFNLKNRPQYSHSGEHCIACNCSKEWFEGFEKELKKMRISGVYETRFDNRLIEEILGE